MLDSRIGGSAFWILPQVWVGTADNGNPGLYDIISRVLQVVVIGIFKAFTRRIDGSSCRAYVEGLLLGRLICVEGWLQGVWFVLLGGFLSNI